MKIQQLQYIDKAWKIYMHAEDFDRMQCQLVLVFGEPSLITDTSVFNYIERSYGPVHGIRRYMLQMKFLVRQPVPLVFIRMEKYHLLMPEASPCCRIKP